MSSGLKTLLEVAPMHSWAETGTSIFCILNLVLVTVSTCFGVGFLTCLSLLTDLQPDAWYLSLGACVVICLTLIFSILLYLGMYQKRPGFVLMYFIFGSVVELSVVALLVVFKNYTLTWRTVGVLMYIDRFVDSGYSMIAGVCVVYALILCMVWHTYYVMVATRSQHQRLDNVEINNTRPTPYYLSVPTLDTVSKKNNVDCL